MDSARRYRWPLIGGGVILLLLVFLAFRPDKLFVDDVVNESLQEAFDGVAANPAASTTTSPETTTIPAETTRSAADPAPPTTTTSATTSATGPETITAGDFYGIAHPGAGTATVYEQDGAYVLRFEDNTDITNGPDLYVWLLADADYQGGTPADYLDLGKLKGNIGGQNYELPAGFDPAVHRAVLIWCRRFSVAFAAAPLT